ncbi:MAG: methylaspartate mutase accessory protein GlmL [Candidatus Binatia bacterium]
MPSLALLIDFGSTFTKVVAVDLDAAQLIGRSQAPSTVGTDVRDGLLAALAGLHERHAIFDRAPDDLSVVEEKIALASSSAAGGLRIAVVGNVPGLTVEAANQSALGAGAKIVGSTAFKLTDDKVRELHDLRPDMILLTGGVNGGDAATILHNGALLAQSALSVPVVVGGNFAVAQKVGVLLKQGGKEARFVDNVMPQAGTLAVESAREEIRKLFMDRITHAKGLDDVKEFVPVVLPTPMAVLEGIRLGADGTANEKGWGDMLVVDVGGATTDVHSVGNGTLAGENVIARGLAEAYAKRTVEGDLGIRFNAATILARVGLDDLAGALRRDFPGEAVSNQMFNEYIEQISDDTGAVPQTPWHWAADAVLARTAVDLAVARHVGRRERIVAREGEAWVHSGKDLRDTRTLIGTGGVFVHNPFATYILSPSAQSDDRVQVLRPKSPNLYFDSSYLLYAVGLLSEKYPDAALQIFKRYITSVA